MTGRVQDWNRQSMKKDGSVTKHGVRDMGSLFHSSAPVMLADGGKVGDEAAKQRGLAESNKEKPMGLFERLRMGNIDQPGSEAYNRLGAGRGRMEADLDKAESEMKSNQANARAGSQAMRDDADFAEVDRGFAGARAVAGAPAPAPRPRRVQASNPAPTRVSVMEVRPAEVVRNTSAERRLSPSELRDLDMTNSRRAIQEEIKSRARTRMTDEAMAKRKAELDLLRG